MNDVMGHLVSPHGYAVEYLRSCFELLDDEEQGMTHWLALMDICTEEWRFEDGQMLVRLIKGIGLSVYARGQVSLALADLYRRQQAWATAAVYYQRALDVFRTLDKRADEAMALNSLALALQDQRDYSEAASLYQEAETIYRALHDHEGMGHVLSNLGSVADEQGDWETAVRYYQQSASALQKAGAHQDLAGVFNNLGVACENQGRLSDAEGWYLRCVDLLDELDEAYSVRGIRILNNLGQLYVRQAEWERAVRCHRAALDICHDQEDVYSESTTWNNLGTVYAMQGDHAQAAECYRTSVDLDHRLGDRQGEALALSNLGAAYADLGDLNLAETCYRNSLAVSQELGEPDGLARVYNNLGVLCETQGLNQEAIEYYKQCAEILRELGESHREVTTLINICTLYETMLATEEAGPHFDRAWKVAERFGYYDHLTTLCSLRGDTTFQHLESYPEGYRWYVRACQYAAGHQASTMDKVTERIQRHLERMRQRGQHDETEAFCRVLMEAWKDDTLRHARPGFADKLLVLMTEKDVPLADTRSAEPV